MPKLRTLSGKEVAAILTANGFSFVSQGGSHMKYQRVNEQGQTVTVIVPDHREVQTGTLCYHSAKRPKSDTL